MVAIIQNSPIGTNGFSFILRQNLFPVFSGGGGIQSSSAGGNEEGILLALEEGVALILAVLSVMTSQHE